MAVPFGVIGIDAVHYDREDSAAFCQIVRIEKNHPFAKAVQQGTVEFSVAFDGRGASSQQPMKNVTPATAEPPPENDSAALKE